MYIVKVRDKYGRVDVLDTAHTIEMAKFIESTSRLEESLRECDIWIEKENTGIFDLKTLRRK